MLTAQKLHIAYLALEFGLDERLPIYAGGLGVLAGDVVLQAQKDGICLTAVGLRYNLSTEQLTACGFALISQTVTIEVGSEEVLVRAWEKKFGSATLLLLDPEGERGSLYDPDNGVFFRQQIILGIGAVRLLGQLGILIDVYHLNEGHTAMAVLELRRLQSPARIVATKHTILSGAGRYLKKDELFSALSSYFEKYQLNGEEIFQSGTHEKHPEAFSTTKFLLKSASKASAVSKLHATCEQKTHPESNLVAVTNGVCKWRWQIPQLALTPLDTMSNEQLWTNHLRYKQLLLEQIREKTAIQFFSDRLTIVWARRLVDYKRPQLIFNDVTRLAKIMTQSNSPVQLIIAGKVNPNTEEGRAILAAIKDAVATPELRDRVVFWPSYDLAVARYLVSGADVWLNTPKLGFEACGTSGMKAGLNGVLQFSVADGWYPEVNWENVGWTLPEESIEKRVYEILENEIIPAYYNRDKLGLSQQWVERMRRTIAVVQKNYTTGRMLNDYFEKLYR